jgi:tRNA(fMet)-specific endonuclease VapC
MYLLDTNHCSNIIIGNPTLLNRLADLEESRITTCVIVQGELIDMAERSQRKVSNLSLIQGFLQGLYIYSIDSESAEIYGRLNSPDKNQAASGLREP